MNYESKKSAENGLYEFTPDGNGCQIYHAETPRYWYNYLWNEERYCAQISQVGHGRSYYLSEKADMCMINRDDARYVYLRWKTTAVHIVSGTRRFVQRKMELRDPGGFSCRRKGFMRYGH